MKEQVQLRRIDGVMVRIDCDRIETYEGDVPIYNIRIMAAERVLGVEASDWSATEDTYAEAMKKAKEMAADWKAHRREHALDT